MKSSKMRLFVLIITISAFVIAILCSIYIKQTSLPASRVYVCDNPKHKSDFDKWITDDLLVDWVPSYIIIKDKKIIGTINGNIPEKTFSSQLGTIVLQNNVMYESLPDFEITNLKGERKAFSDIITDDKVYILEVSWASCEDCVNQDKHYTNSIYAMYSTDNFYRYYINTEVDEVKHKYH